MRLIIWKRMQNKTKKRKSLSRAAQNATQERLCFLLEERKTSVLRIVNRAVFYKLKNGKAFRQLSSDFLLFFSSSSTIYFLWHCSFTGHSQHFGDAPQISPYFSEQKLQIILSIAAIESPLSFDNFRTVLITSDTVAVS